MFTNAAVASRSALEKDSEAEAAVAAMMLKDMVAGSVPTKRIAVV